MPTSASPNERTPLTFAYEAEAASLLPPHHKDPMDRMLIATAMMYNLVILTDDRSFASYDVRTLW